MLLAIDVGNTNMVFGLIEGDALTGSFRLMTDANRTSDEIGLAAWDYFCLLYTSGLYGAGSHQRGGAVGAGPYRR